MNNKQNVPPKMLIGGMPFSPRQGIMFIGGLPFSPIQGIPYTIDLPPESHIIFKFKTGRITKYKTKEIIYWTQRISPERYNIGYSFQVLGGIRLHPDFHWMKENLIDIEIIIGDFNYKHINPQIKNSNGIL